MFGKQNILHTYSTHSADCISVSRCIFTVTLEWVWWVLRVMTTPSALTYTQKTLTEYTWVAPVCKATHRPMTSPGSRPPPDWGVKRAAPSMRPRLRVLKNVRLPVFQEKASPLLFRILKM